MLNYSDIVKKYDHKINYGQTEGSIIDIIDDINSGTYGTYDFDVYLPTIGMNLQRDFVWTELQKQQLILAILRGVSLPKFVKIRIRTGSDHTQDIHQIIDGKQRLNTIISFIKGEFAIEHKGNKYYFNDLDGKLQYIMRDVNIVWDVHYSYGYNVISDQTKIDIFEQINFLGTPQEQEHLNNLKKKQ